MKDADISKKASLAGSQASKGRAQDQSGRANRGTSKKRH